MRVVDSLFFALAFLVDYIVCTRPPIQNPNPPYRVVRLLAIYLPDIYVECEVKRPGSEEGYYEYCKVQGSLDVVIKGDTIIGYVDHSDELVPIRSEYGHLFQKLKLRSPHPETMYGREAAELGMYQKLPENTIYELPVRKGAPPPHRMILHKDREGNVLYTELVSWRPWRIQLVQSPDGRWVSNQNTNIL